MPTTTDALLAAYDERIEALGREIAAKQAERDGLVRARAALAGDLTNAEHSGKPEGMAMIPQVRVRHSRGKQRKMTEGGEQPSRIVVIANAAGHSLHSLAEAIEEAQGSGTYSASALSQAATKGGIGMPEARAKLIQKLTRSKEYPKGIEPTVEFWPQLRVKQ